VDIKTQRKKMGMEKQIDKEEAQYYKSKHILDNCTPGSQHMDNLALETVPIEHIKKYKEETGKVFFEEEDGKLYRVDSEQYKEFNWSSGLNSWEMAKGKAVNISRKGDLVFFAHDNDEIKGKPQILDNETKKNIILLLKCCKKDKKTGEENINYKFLDDSYDKRYDGYEIESIDKSFWAYRVVDNGEEYVLLIDKIIPTSEVHKFKGMKVKIKNQNELLKDLKCKGTKQMFFCKSIEPSIKIIPKEELIDFMGDFVMNYKLDLDTVKDFFFDFPFMHPDGMIYRQPEDYMMVRHAQLLSGKVDGYPLSMFCLGVPGSSKTIELECLDSIFDESIAEAGNSTPKSLVPSFKESPATPGFIMSKNRIALIDEIMKMIEKQMEGNYSISTIKNKLSELNMIFEHKRRSIGSGNNNSFTGQATAKTIIVGNPASNMNYLADHLKILDESTLSRLFIWIKDVEHKDFVRNNQPKSIRNTYTTYLTCFFSGDELKNEVCIEKVFRGFLYDYYLSIYDSCQQFIIDYEEERLRTLYLQVSALCPDELKNVWEARGMHHVKLILDGLTKFRCIFKDLDKDFRAKDEDYDYCEKILIKMIKGWSAYLKPTGAKFNGNF
jgi:hypothetical protein